MAFFHMVTGIRIAFPFNSPGHAASHRSMLHHVTSAGCGLAPLSQKGRAFALRALPSPLSPLPLVSAPPFVRPVAAQCLQGFSVSSLCMQATHVVCPW